MGVRAETSKRQEGVNLPRERLMHCLPCLAQRCTLASELRLQRPARFHPVDPEVPERGGSRSRLGRPCAKGQTEARRCEAAAACQCGMTRPL